jgi:hypothetical protein
VTFATRGCSIILFSAHIAGYGQTLKCAESAKGIEGDYERILDGDGYKHLVELGIHGSEYVLKSTIIRRKNKESILQRFSLCRIRDDYFIVKEIASDSYTTDSNGSVDRRFGAKITGMPVTSYKTLRVTKDGLTEGLASLYTGRSKRLEGRWVSNYQYRKDSTVSRESTVVEIGAQRTKVSISSHRSTSEYATAISEDTLTWSVPDRKTGFSHRYRISSDTLFMESLKAVMEYKRRIR